MLHAPFYDAMPGCENNSMLSGGQKTYVGEPKFQLLYVTNIFVQGRGISWILSFDSNTIYIVP